MHLSAGTEALLCYDFNHLSDARHKDHSIPRPERLQEMMQILPGKFVEGLVHFRRRYAILCERCRAYLSIESSGRSRNCVGEDS